MRNFPGQVTRRGRVLGVWFKDSPDPPPAPNYAQAAQVTAAGNADAARAAATANRIDQYTPLGAIRYTPGVGGNQDHWRSDISLTPQGQTQFDQSQRINTSLNNVAENGLGYVKNTLATPFNWNSLPGRNINAGQTAQDALMSRLEPQFARDEESLRSRLINQGITQGSEAENQALEQFGRGKTDARLQAALQGFGYGDQARQQAIQEQSFARNEPLNMINALRSGSQVQMPSFSSPGQQQTTTGPDLLGAANSQYNSALGGYNAQQAGNSNFMNGLFSLGAGALSNPGIWAASDRRVKQNIEQIGILPSGLPVYKFEYLSGEPAEGVMADEVAEFFPEAVRYSEEGYGMVDYAAIH
jgi:hypothetical protein